MELADRVNPLEAALEDYGPYVSHTDLSHTNLSKTCTLSNTRALSRFLASHAMSICVPQEFR